jgi:DNA-binding LacI/PurR family transcriptional regulator
MANIQDVAKAAQVSIASVSLTLSDPATKRVGAEKKKLILETAKRLGYTPNVLARGLHRLGTRILGLVVPMRDPIFFNLSIAEVLSGIQQCLIERGYHLIIYSHAASHGRITENEIIQSKATDGLIFINTRLCTRTDVLASIKELHDASVPFVMINSAQDIADIDYVGVDEERLGVIAAEYLTAAGFRDIGILNGPASSPTTGLILDSFQRTLRRARCPLRKAWSVFGDYERTQTVSAIQSLMSRPDRPRALFCTSDQMAPDVYSALKDLGIKVPRDLAVLSRGDLVYAQYLQPPLTTIRVPMRAVGYEAAKLLIDRLTGQQATPRRILLHGDVVRRQSA